MDVTSQQLCSDAALELNVVAQGETLGDAAGAVLLNKLRRLIDNWNAESPLIYAVDFLSFTFTPNLNPHTIGPTGTWTVTSRPVSIEGANVVLTPGPNQINAPQITFHDAAWYQAITTPNLTTSYPTDAFYDATYPNGSLYLWPVPSTAYGIQLLVRSVLADVSMNTTLSLPPGYRDAITLTLAEDSIGAFAVPEEIVQQLPRQAAKARTRIGINNTDVPLLVTRDSGMPSANGRRSNWNWLTGMLTK